MTPHPDIEKVDIRVSGYPEVGIRIAGYRERKKQTLHTVGVGRYIFGYPDTLLSTSGYPDKRIPDSRMTPHPDIEKVDIRVSGYPEVGIRLLGYRKKRCQLDLRS